MNDKVATPPSHTVDSSHTVEKIGGTSITATEAVFDNVLIGGRTGADLYRRVFVVSAYAGMTDLLLENKKTGEAGVYRRFLARDSGSSWREALDAARDAMLAKNVELFEKAASRADADAFLDRRIGWLRDCLDAVDRLRARRFPAGGEPLAALREMLAGLGEAHSAHNTALRLRDLGVDAVCVDLTASNGSGHMSLDERIVRGFANIDFGKQLPIVTGYVQCDEGMVRRYGRGYSEITFSRAAVITEASEAILHKEFHLSSADPCLVGEDKARKIGRTNYNVADQLANLRMEAIHPGAGRGLRQAGIPLRVKNIFEPHDDGTLICGDYVSDVPRVEIVAGIRALFTLEFFEQDMVGEKGYDAAILEALTRHKAWIVCKASNANTITHYLSAPADVVNRVAEELDARFPNAAVAAHDASMVALIGSDLADPGFVATALSALAEANVRVLGLHHQIRNVDIQFIVARTDFEAAIRTLHAALVEAPAAPSPSNSCREAA